MALTEKEKKHIEEEEAYRAQIRDETQHGKQTTPTPKKGMSGCLIVFLLFFAFVAIIIIAVNPGKQFEVAEKKAEQARQWESTITPFSAYEIANKAEDEIKNTYVEFYKNYSDTGLTPSGNVRITGFDIENANIQIDYAVATNELLYVGYSFAANPLTEEIAWKLTGVSKPFSEPASNPGIMNRTVYIWENIEEIEPYKMIQAIYEPDGKVGKIAFSKEDLETAKSSRSLYYVP